MDARGFRKGHGLEDVSLVVVMVKFVKWTYSMLLDP